MDHYTVCIVNTECMTDSDGKLGRLNKLLTDMHAAMCKLHAKASMHILYSPAACSGADTTGTTTSTNSPQTAFITHHADPEKFAKKTRDALRQCYHVSVVQVVEAVKKMVSVWRRKAAGLVVISLVVVGDELQGVVEQCGCDGVAFSSGHVGVDGGEGLSEYLCEKYHLRPAYVDGQILGLLLMPWLELPTTKSTFADRKLQLHRLNSNTNGQLVIASHKLPIVLIDSVPLEANGKFMDGEGRVYEYVEGFMYRRVVENHCDEYSEVECGECVEMVIRAHLLDNSILMLPPQSLYMHQFLNNYEPVLFNPKYPLLHQLSTVLRAMATTTARSTNESEMLSQLLQAITSYHRATSGDLFHISDTGEGTSVRELYSSLRLELEFVGVVASGLEAVISGAYDLVDVDTGKRVKGEERPGVTAYLTIQRTDKPQLPQLKNPLLSRYYRMHALQRRNA